MTCLTYEPETCLLGSDGALIDVVPASDLEAHRSPAIREGVPTSADVLGHVQRSALEVISHGICYIFHAQFASRLHEERHPVLKVLAHYIIEVVVCILGYHLPIFFVGEFAVAQNPESAPSPCVACPHAPEINRIVGGAEVEVLVLAAEVAFAASEFDYIRRIQAVLRVVERESLDSRLVRMCADVPVRNPPGNPHQAFIDVFPVFHFNSLAYQVHHPGFVFVGDGKALALRRIAIFIGKVYYHLYSLASSPGSLQRHVNQ